MNTSWKAVRTSRKAAAVAVLAAAVAAVSVPGAAHADDGSVFVKVTYVSAAIDPAACDNLDVWGVVLPQGDPKRDWGNYEVCNYSTSYTSVGDWQTGLGDAQDTADATAQIKKAANAETSPRHFSSYCVYYMPAGPDRYPAVTVQAKHYDVELIYRNADGVDLVVDRTTGSYSTGTRVTWTPSCSTYPK